MSTVGVVNHHELNMAPNEKQGVAITERNTTGPPSRDAPWWVTLQMRVLQTTTDASDRYYSGPPPVCIGGPVINRVDELFNNNNNSSHDYYYYYRCWLAAIQSDHFQAAHNPTFPVTGQNNRCERPLMSYYRLEDRHIRVTLCRMKQRFTWPGPLSVCLHISKTTLPNFLYVLSVAVAQYSSDDILMYRRFCGWQYVFM